MPQRQRRERELNRYRMRNVRQRVDIPIALRGDENPEACFLGNLDNRCIYCQARHFIFEKSSGGFTKCCRKGKIQTLQATQSDTIMMLLTSGTREAKNYREHIRSYNSAMAMVSSKAEVNEPQNGVYHYKIQGTIYHGHGPLIPKDNSPTYSQLYFFENEAANHHRINHARNANCDPRVFDILSNHLDDVNPYVQIYKQMFQIVQSGEFGDPLELKLSIVNDRSCDQRRYNPASANDVAAIFTSADGSPPGERDLIIYPLNENSATRRISVISSYLDPLAYPLLFPFGDMGWHPDIGFTMLQYAQHRIAIRLPDILHLSQKLFLQYVVDLYVRIEGTRLQWIRLNQKSLRVETYKGLTDFVQTRAERDNLRVGRCVILPSSFINSPRNMQEKYQDAMAIVRKFGKPDIFLTFTANPNWIEIQNEIRQLNQAAWMRPDITVRVFYGKLKMLQDDILKKNIFGNVAALIYTIEFQKRGLPHCHMLISLEEEFKFKSEDIGKINLAVSAELPDRDAEPLLWDLVTSHMVHGPCGLAHPRSLCMKNDTCSKHFPKQYVDETKKNESGFPEYRRRNNGTTFTKNNFKFDNQWIVPYNRYLLLKYQSHINIEICTTVASVKYIYKYIYKGYDCATAQFKSGDTLDYDEIDAFLDTRWVGSCEAAWRMFEYEMHYQSHNVVRLDCHLPDQQRVYFQENNEDHAIESVKNTKLQAWFKLNETDVEARQYLYIEIPEHYTWNDSLKSWKPRKRFTKVVSRLYTVNPKDRELFFLRLLLLHVRGAKSFNNLKTINGTLCDTFQEAAIMLGIATDDSCWRNAIAEAVQSKLPYQIRELFAVICALNFPSNCKLLWETFKHALSEDYLRDTDEETAYNRSLLDIEDILNTHNTSCENLGMPVPARRVNVPQTDGLLNDHIELYQQMFDQATPEQRNVISTVISAVSNNSRENSNLFFLDAPAGCGKTYVQRTVMAYVRANNRYCIPVASTGIAASLLEGGSTIHSQFKLPINLTHESVSGITPNSPLGEYIKRAALTIIDEVSSTLSEVFTVLDRLYKDLVNEADRLRPFGGKVVFVCGDFRQCLPVICHGNRSTIVQHCLIKNPLWQQMKKFNLNKNMRVNEGEEEFANYLLNVGNGNLPNAEDNNHEVSVLSSRLNGNGNGTAIDFIYGDVDLLDDTIIDSAILCPTNDDCWEINKEILKKIPHEERDYISYDTIISDDPAEENRFPTEFLNTIEVSGLPRHRLKLKVGSIVMLMRNLNIKRGLINGTRLRILELNSEYIECRILTGVQIGEKVLIPKVKLNASESTLSIPLQRQQYPLSLAFAFTINKSQGQSLSKVGIYLKKPVFSHGQLYVALSRARSFSGVRIFIEYCKHQGILESGEIYTKNVVWSEVLSKHM